MGREFDPSLVSPTTPLRLSRAVELAWPEGGMTVSGLRREAARGRLVMERVAGKDFVTLAAIERMRELCRVGQKGLASGSGQPSPTLRPARSGSWRAWM